MQSNWWPNMGVLNKLNVNTYSVYSNQSTTNVDGAQSMSGYSGMMSDRCYLSSSIQNFFLKVSNTRCYCIPGWSWYLLMLNYLTKHKLGSKTWVWVVLKYWYLTFVTTEGGCTKAGRLVGFADCYAAIVLGDNATFLLAVNRMVAFRKQTGNRPPI